MCLASRFPFPQPQLLNSLFLRYTQIRAKLTKRYKLVFLFIVSQAYGAHYFAGVAVGAAGEDFDVFGVDRDSF